MDLSPVLDWWQHLRVAWAATGLCLALVAGMVIWRVRGLLNWKRSQRKELTILRRSLNQAESEHCHALGEVLAACEAIWSMTSPDLARLADLPAYWRRIAACYFPDEPEPELCISVGQLLAAARQLAGGLDKLLQRPGFARLGQLRIRQVRRTYSWYLAFSANRVVAWIMRRRRMLRGIWHTLRLVLPDPLAWIAYLSRRLTMMMAVRCLLVDVFLFTGRVAVDTFHRRDAKASPSAENDDAEAVLDAFESTLKATPRPVPDELRALRNDLVGLPARLWNPPDFGQWRRAIEQAARLIAADYFPDADAPLEEARCRVLLDRGRYWLQAMSDAQRLPVVRPLYGVTLKRLIQLKDISESDLLRRTGKMAAGAWTAWRWARWPIRIFRWVRRRTPAGAAVEVGFSLAGKAAVNYLARYSFDRACRELDAVYRLSRYPGPDPSASEIPRPPYPADPME